MNEQISILIIENEPLILYAIEKALEDVASIQPHLNFKSVISKKCDEIYFNLDNMSKTNQIDLVIMNMDMQPTGSKKVVFIEDLGQKLKEVFPEIKIIALTSYQDNYKINAIIQSLNPESFLLKNELDFEELVRAIHTVLLETPYYSKVILRLIRSLITCDFSLDRFDKLILYYLSKGTRTKDLPNFVHLSIGAIERRKRQLKTIFDVVNGDDRILLQRAQEKGFI